MSHILHHIPALICPFVSNISFDIYLKQNESTLCQGLRILNACS